MTTHRVPEASAILATFALALAAPCAAQTSEYFVMAGDQSTFHVLQGGVRLRSWSPAPASAQYQYPLAITNAIRTMGANAGEIGAQYSFTGADLGPRYTHPAGSQRTWDGTTDGLSNYSIDSAGSIYRSQADWSNPVLLFTAPSFGGITYDPTTNSLWVSLWTSSTVTNYTMAGAVISSFSTGHTQNMALALDHADGTLWLHDRNATGTFEQWSTTGSLLTRIAIPGMNTQNALGGEFAFRQPALCSFRNGSGMNPADYACVTRPILGTTWTTSFNSNTSTALTGVVFGIGGRATGPALFNGEALVALAPSPVLVIGTGNISMAIPNNQNLIGASLPTQGMRLDTGAAGLLVVLLNAQDLQLGL